MFMKQSSSLRSNGPRMSLYHCEYSSTTGLQLFFVDFAMTSISYDTVLIKEILKVGLYILFFKIVLLHLN